MKKTKLLTLTALTLIGLLGLSSCGSKGEKGDTGATGPAGETGPKGDKGDPGEDGKDGEDGSTWLTGTSKPSETLGKVGDMYLNTSNGDVYQKEESGWTLKMNIQGEDGEDGKDGTNGSNGSSGPKGDTAWSNTILPSENGYVVPSIGSGVKGTTFTINAYPSTNYYLKSLTLIDKEGNLTSPSYSLDETTNVVVSEEVSMVEGGYVISATFESTSSLGATGYVDGKKYNGTYDAAGNFVPNLDNPVSDAPTFEGGDGKSEETALEVGSAEQLNEINKVEETYFKLNSDIETTSLTLSGSGVEGDTYEKVIDLNENTMKFTTTSSSFVVNKGLDLTLKNGTIDSNEENGIASIGLGDRTNKDVSGGTLNLEGMTLNNLNNGIVIESKGSELNIKDTTINSAIMPLSTNASLGKDVTDVSITVDNSKLISKGDETNHDGVGLLINTNVDVNIVNHSYIEGPRQALIVRGGNVNIEDSTICFSNTYKGDDTEFDNVWESGNEVAYAGIVIGDTSTTSYDYPASLTLSNVIYSRSNPSSNEVTTLSEESETRSEPYDIYMYGESETNTATLNIDSSTYAQFDSSNIYKNEHSFINVTGIEATSTNAFFDGQLYSELYLKDDGSVDETLSTKVDGVKFAGGDGSETNPLQIESSEQWKLFNNENVKDKYYYFVLNNDIDLNDGGEQITSLKAHIDLNTHSVTLLKSAWAINTLSGSVKNGSILNPEERATESFIYKNDGDILLEGITVGDPVKETYVNVSTNTTIFLGNVYKDDDCDVIFRNCVNYVDYGIKNDGQYGGAFIGGWTHNLPADSNNPVLFENCINYGDFKQQNGAAFVGNSTEITDKTYKFINCKNYGDITGTETANVYVANTQNISDEEFIEKYKLSGIENFGNVVCGKNLDSSFTFSKNGEGKLVVTGDLGEEYQNVTYKVDLEVAFDWLNASGVKIGQNRSHQVINVNSLDEIDIYVASLDKTRVYVDQTIEETSKNYVKFVYDEESEQYKAYVNNLSLDQVQEGSYIGLSDQEIKIFITVLDENGNPIGFTSVKTLCDIK